MEACGASAEGLPKSEVYVARVDDSVGGAAFSLVSALRDAGIAAETDHQGRSLKSQFKQADRLGARLVAVLGPDEVSAGQVKLRDMGTKDETTVALVDTPSAVLVMLGR